MGAHGVEVRALTAWTPDPERHRPEGVEMAGHVMAFPPGIREPSPLWLQAHAACNGNREDMWDWLERRYLELAGGGQLRDQLERVRVVVELMVEDKYIREDCGDPDCGYASCALHRVLAGTA